MLEALAALSLSLANGPTARPETCDVEIVVLGAGQDAGAPQIGRSDDPAWEDRALSLTATSLGLVNRRHGARFIFDAAPEIRDHLKALDDVAPRNGDKGADLGVDGIFLTHAHIGHYTGLMFLGREAAGARDVPVYAMPRMKAFLEENAPWAQLVTLRNIDIRPLSANATTRIDDVVSVTPIPVPHRDEYSETVGYWIDAAAARAFFLPDIDSWDSWRDVAGIDIADVVRNAHVAFIDATFFMDGELANRDMSDIPHPRVAATMERLAALPAADKAKVRFIHYNHTNPIRHRASPHSRQVENLGFGVARAGDRHCLAPIVSE
ncbi:MAG: MBL fold metallo-hydrolase [Alphaproteobacteria bacterium]|nr:MBL fold metallo-hydrolase [Alphaproteobacteria bacterium]